MCAGTEAIIIFNIDASIARERGERQCPKRFERTVINLEFEQPPGRPVDPT